VNFILYEKNCVGKNKFLLFYTHAFFKLLARLDYFDGSQKTELVALLVIYFTDESYLFELLNLQGIN